MRPEGLFVIDSEQRILEWSSAATAAIGVPATDALGQPCYQVVQGRDAFGRLACQKACPPFRALQRGRLVAQCTLHLKVDSGESPALRCELMALPEAAGDGAGRALARLLSRTPNPHLGDEREESRPPSWGSGTVVRDLTALSTLATSLSPATAHKSLERALDILCQATGAEAGEVFLAEHVEKGIVLASHWGLFKHAFSQMTRFRAGEGYPGLVLARREPILTRSLAEDSRYLRTLVKERRFSSYACMPIIGPHRLIGSLHLASRRADFDLESASRLLSWASTPIGLMLQAAAAFPDDGGSQSWTQDDGPVEENANQLLRGLLRHMSEMVGASGAALSVRDSSGDLVRLVQQGVDVQSACPGLRSGTSKPCPALEECRVLTLFGARKGWPQPCQQAFHSGHTMYCVPVTDSEGVLGLIQMGWRERSPHPPTQYVWPLQELAWRAAPTVRLARDDLEERRRTEAAFRAVLSMEGPQDQPRRALAASRSATGAGKDILSHSEEPYLDVRCLGSFELRRGGTLVSSHEVHRRKAMSLLKILLTYEGHPQSKETLMELLWPEVAPDVGASRLWVVVHALRQLVEPPDSRGAWVYIKSEGDRYVFASDAPCRVDVRDFKAFLRLGQEAEARGDVRGAVAAFEAAADLYRGDFLEDEPFAEWCWMEREHIRESYLNIRQVLAALCAKTGDAERSVTHLRFALRADPVREETHRDLMRYLWITGQRDAALRQYEICRELLQRELGVEPLPETQSLAQTIRDS